MKRRVFTILVFLLLGAIVNVAVAWGLNHSIRVKTERVLKTRVDPKGIGSTIEYEGPIVVTFANEVGWPWPSLQNAQPVVMQSRFCDGPPLCPLWPGFAINTVFYAVVLWVLFAAPFALRRRRRIRRGLCPACAYPVGESSVCTECGKRVRMCHASGGTSP